MYDQFDNNNAVILLNTNFGHEWTQLFHMIYSINDGFGEMRVDPCSWLSDNWTP